jgi:hypothetical protein
MHIGLVALVGLFAGLLKLPVWVLGLALVVAVATALIPMQRRVQHHLRELPSAMQPADVLFAASINGVALVLPYVFALAARWFIAAAVN